MNIEALNINNRQDFRKWLKENHDKAKECYLILKRGKPVDDNAFYYLDAVEEALCFGWIDSTVRKIDGKLYQRFSKRRKNSPFSELNRERVKRLINLKLMDESGLDAVKDVINRKYVIDEEIIRALKDARVYNKFKRLPDLYKRIRTYNIAFYKYKDQEAYAKALKHFVEMTKQNKMYGEWNDYGRLL